MTTITDKLAVPKEPDHGNELIARFRELFDIDLKTGVLRWKAKSSNYSRVKLGHVAGCLDGSGHLQVMVDGKRLGVHRIVFAMANGFFPKQVDHINGVGDDNRVANLRAATTAENQRNSRICAKNTSGIKGVSWHNGDGKWRAQCRFNGRNHTIGRFSSINEAAAAVQAFREAHHKEFSRHA